MEDDLVWLEKLVKNVGTALQRFEMEDRAFREKRILWQYWGYSIRQNNKDFGVP